jgi:excisionase family DNA binding protein
MRLPDPTEQPLVTVEDAGRWLGLGRSAAYAAVRRGDLPSIQIGRRVFVPTAELRRLVGLDAVEAARVEDDVPALRAVQ